MLYFSFFCLDHVKEVVIPAGKVIVFSTDTHTKEYTFVDCSET